MEFSLSLKEHLAQSAMLHSRLCPRQVLGVRMARFACSWFGIDPAIERKQIFVYMEIGRCAADGVMVVTYASPQNQLMQLMPYGKVAATFVHLRTGETLRVSEHPSSREAVKTLALKAESSWEAQLEGYQILPDEILLRWQTVALQTTLPHIPEKHAVSCDSCGDRVNENQEIIRDGLVMCKACAMGAYYEEITPVCMT
jgi:formylmethanofuran dehydrogenase subunit E